MSNKITTIGFVALSILATSAFAADKFDWSPCNAEMAKFCKGMEGKSDEDIYQCLLKHDVDLSSTCDKDGHNKYEILTGKTKK